MRVVTVEVKSYRSEEADLQADLSQTNSGFGPYASVGGEGTKGMKLRQEGSFVLIGVEINTAHKTDHCALASAFEADGNSVNVMGG